MSITWGVFRDQVRAAVLKDTAASRWDDEQLAVFVGWALDAFCAHTAVATATSFTGVTGMSVQMPDNIYERLDLSAQVVLNISTDSPVYLNPLFMTQGVSPRQNSGGRFFYELPDETLVFDQALTSPTEVTVRYFAFYNHPVSDDDTIDVPRWALPALGYLIGAHAITAYSMGRAQLAQWAESPEKGDPEDNPFRVQQKWLEELYEREISRHTAQKRSNFWRYT